MGGQLASAGAPGRWSSLLGGARALPLVRHGSGAVLAGVAVWIFTELVSPYTNYELAGVALYVVATAGLTVLTGVNGQISLGHGALMAVGAYSTALLLEWQPDLNLFLVLLCSGAATLVAGTLFGAAAARLRGPYLAGVTLTLALALPTVALHFSAQFGGEQGVTVPTPTPPSALGPGVTSEQWLAWIAAAVALLVLVGLANLLRSGVGRSFRAVRDDEVAAALAGIQVGRTRVLAFVVSSGCAGLAGSLFAYWLGLTAPGGFSPTLSLQLLIVIVIGGMGSLLGAVWGAIFLIAVPDLTGGLASAYNLPSTIGNGLPLAIFSAALILSVLLFPRGLQGGLSRLGRYLRARIRGSPVGAPG